MYYHHHSCYYAGCLEVLSMQRRQQQHIRHNDTWHFVPMGTSCQLNLHSDAKPTVHTVYCYNNLNASDFKNMRSSVTAPKSGKTSLILGKAGGGFFLSCTAFSLQMATRIMA